MSSPAFAIPPDLTRDTGVWPGDGPIRFGSDEHKRLFCKTLLDTHDPYKPAVLDWPRLGEEAEKRITSLPIWDIAVQTENRAGLNVCTYAESVRDPLLRKAIELERLRRAPPSPCAGQSGRSLWHQAGARAGL